MDTAKPIPAFYCAYLLRSITNKRSLYVGSTPHPVRRLKQHNGLVKGGAVRTSKASLRPWDMVCIVTGFPSHIAALQFEWAWQNSHISLKIPSDQRITARTTKIKTIRKTGATRKRVGRPQYTLSDKLANLHLLLRVESFARWPLTVKFFITDVYEAWQRLLETSDTLLGPATSIEFLPRNEGEKPEKGPCITLASITGRKEKDPTDGVHELDVTYAAFKSHIEKSISLLSSNTITCKLCSKSISDPHDFAMICPNSICTSVNHMTCLATDFLRQEVSNGLEDPPILPIQGKCPSCKKDTKWIDIVKEHSIRRKAGPFDQVFSTKKKRGAKATKDDVIVLDSEEGEEGLSQGSDMDNDEELSAEELYSAQDYEQWFSKPEEDMHDAIYEGETSSEEESVDGQERAPSLQ